MDDRLCVCMLFDPILKKSEGFCFVAIFSTKNTQSKIKNNQYLIYLFLRITFFSALNNPPPTISLKFSHNNQQHLGQQVIFNCAPPTLVCKRKNDMVH